jgi:hypothetical protein
MRGGGIKGVGLQYHRVAPRCRRCHPAVCRCLLVPRLSLAPASALREQSLAAAGVGGGAVVLLVVGPLFVIDHLRSTPRAAACSGGVGYVLGVGPFLGCRCPPALLALPLVLILVRTIVDPSFVLSLPSSSLVLAALFLVVVYSLLSSSVPPRLCCPCVCFVLVPSPSLLSLSVILSLSSVVLVST